MSHVISPTTILQQIDSALQKNDIVGLRDYVFGFYSGEEDITVGSEAAGLLLAEVASYLEFEEAFGDPRWRERSCDRCGKQAEAD